MNDTTWQTTEPRTAATPPPPPQSPRLLDRLRDALRVRHYGLRTEKTYAHWVCRYPFCQTHRRNRREFPDVPESEECLMVLDGHGHRRAAHNLRPVWRHAGYGPHADTPPQMALAGDPQRP